MVLTINDIDNQRKKWMVSIINDTNNHWYHQPKVQYVVPKINGTIYNRYRRLFAPFVVGTIDNSKIKNKMIHIKLIMIIITKIIKSLMFKNLLSPIRWIHQRT